MVRRDEIACGWDISRCRPDQRVSGNDFTCRYAAYSNTGDAVLTLPAVCA